jgi:hypothetical protein
MKAHEKISLYAAVFAIQKTGLTSDNEQFSEKKV